MAANPVASMTSTQAALEAKRVLPRALVEGTEAMRAKGKAYLPIFPAEEELAWQARRDQTVLFPAYREAIDLAVGLIFRKTVAGDVPEMAKPWLEDVDRQGTAITQFAEAVLRDAFNGVSYIVADYPKVAPGLTLAQEHAMGARPYLVHVKCGQVLGWRTQVVNGQHILTQFRYKEAVTEADGAFGEKTTERIRVLEPGMVTVWVKHPTKDEWAIDLDASGAVTLQEVPVVAVYTGKTGFMAGEPPMLDLAWKNVEHWQSASDQRAILHVARVPILKVIGVSDPGTFKISPDSLLTLPPGADAAWIEHGGKAIEAGAKDLETIEAQMRVMAGKILDQSVQKTAYQAGVESTQAMSRVQAWALGIHAALNAAWALCGKWIKQDLGTLTVNTDVDLSKPDAQMLAEIRNAVAAGLLTKETYLKVLQASETMPEDFDPQDEIARLGEEPPALELPNRQAQE